jgi:hypothetical protein
MQTVKIGNTTYKTDRFDIFAHHAKCTGKHKPVKPKKNIEKRVYPIYREGMSTAQYVEWYENVNKTLRKWDWQPLSTAPTLASGEDSAWEVADAASDL